MTLIEELVADGPWVGREPEMELYGRLAGTWDVVNRYFVEERDEWVAGTAVWTFGWILAGHAVQDVMWFTAPGPDGYPQRVTGSAVRHYDPAAKSWTVVWFATTGTVFTLTGRAGDGGDIVQEGTQPDGRPIRWLFTEVTGESFRWLGYVSDDGGATWRLEQEMLARRR
ncbi:hypothetical protein [Paractinoplanes toevensis]|uniref:DUF1579 domain-containing protein n=1 Tax=Paractinoplanes toevensis TaxID=571911 RepID=A0A919T7C1_9ACTN|nr:hypothetical protein [Actinoplanes toevensis]GIM90729.1 hypothetical protein Ato02nite_025220 [Actinoplanes toevensis]